MNTTNNISIFNNENFGSLRVVTRDGEPWFIAKDVCDSLGFDKPADAVRGLDEDEKGTHIMRGTPGNPDKTIISEAGLYSLILRSRKPEAKAFKRWITHEVLPSIRKHGAYIPVKENDTPEMIMARGLKAAESIVLELKTKIEQDAPLIQLATDFLEEGDCINIADLAKKLNQEELPLGRDRLFAFLRSEGILCSKKDTSAYNTPTQYYMERKWFKLKETPVRIHGEVVFKKVTLVTPKGVRDISEYVHACFSEQVS